MTPKQQENTQSPVILPYADPDLFPVGLAVVEWGRRPELKYYNEELPKIFGCSGGELEARTLFPAKSPALKHTLERAAESGEKLTATFVAEKADASAMWLYISASVEKKGKKLVCSAAVYDVTLEKSIIRKLDAEQEKNRLLRDVFSALTFDYDPIADIFTLNGPSPRVFRQLIGRFPQTELIHKEDRAQFYWWLSLKDKAARSTLRFRADFDGSGYQEYQGTMAVISDKYGTPYHCAGVFQRVP